MDDRTKINSIWNIIKENKMGFKKFLDNLREETTSADIATVDTKLDMTRRKKGEKGKKCKVHKRPNCQECLDEQHDDFN